MSKAISSYLQSEREGVIARRLKEKQGGLGYLAAVDAQKRASSKELVTKIVKAIKAVKQ